MVKVKDADLFTREVSAMGRLVMAMLRRQELAGDELDTLVSCEVERRMLPCGHGYFTVTFKVIDEAHAKALSMLEVVDALLDAAAEGGQDPSASVEVVPKSETH